MSVEYQNSILWRGEDPTKQKFQPKYDGTKKIARYFPGQAPKWGDDVDEDDEEEFLRKPLPKAGTSSRKEPPKGEGFSRHGKTGRATDRKREEERKPTAVVEDAAIGRLRRLQAQSQAGEVGHAERLLRHRTIHDARILEAAQEDGEVLEECDKESKEDVDVKEEDKLDADEADIEDIVKKEDDDLDEGTSVPVVAEAPNEDDLRAMRRERARELALSKRKEEEMALLKEEEEGDEPVEEDEDEEESEEESASEDDDPRRGAMMKPQFISRNQRETLKEREAIEKEEEDALERKKVREKERKAESKTLVVDEIRREEEAERDGLNDNELSDMELIDDDDEKNEAEEYEKWKIRELKRMKRDKEERVERQKEFEYIERRRRMTDEEREADDRRLDGSAKQREEAKQFNFMQKYYHRGGFFQDKARTGEEPLYLRDYHEPLAEEKYDKQLLPKAMQLRRGEFGKKGQVKHTHLTDSDTTDMTAAWAQHNKQVQRYQEKMAGAKGIMHFDRPSLRSSGSSS